MKTKVNNNNSFLEEIPIHLVQYSEVISAVKPLLNFSRLFGVPGLSYIDSIVSKGGFCSFLNFWNIFLLTNQIFLLIMSLAKGEDFVKKSGIHIIMRVHVILIHLWSLIYTPKLGKALRNAPGLENRLKIYKDTRSLQRLRRMCIIFTVIYVLLSLFLTFKSFFIEIIFPTKGQGSSSSMSAQDAWESYGNTNCKLDGGTFYHPSITSAYCLLITLATNFVWVFGDFLLIILAIVMGELYRRLNKGISAMEADRFSAVEIDLVREHHGLTSKLVSDFDDAISVLNLINIIFNTAFLVLGSYSLLIGIGTRANRRRTFGPNTDPNEKGMIVEVACKLAVVVFKFLGGLIAASILHRRAHAALAHVRSWPMARELHEFSLHHGRASVIHAFLGQLSSPSIGFTFSKFATITAKLMTVVALGVGIFFVFTKIILSTCSRNSRLTTL